jgi:hypothetical protein
VDCGSITALSAMKKPQRGGSVRAHPGANSQEFILHTKPLM